MRAKEVDAAMARSFLKAVGGKTRLLPELLARVPKAFGAYHEPFVGGGALFFALAPRLRWAHLGDTNAHFVDAYRGVRDDVEGVIRRLRRMKNDEAYYYRMRERVGRPASDVERAALTIFLNKTSYNGLWRENRRGEMNAPFGHYAKPKICDAANLRACSEAMRQCKSKVVVESFERAAERVEEGDFWYADPPYLPVDAKSFTGYGATGFGYADHVRLRDVAWMLAERGAHVLLSNADTPTARELYDRKPFRIETVYAPRTINSKGDGRGAVAELLISAG